MRFLAVHTSFPNRMDAQRVSRILIEEKLAACANILTARSIYHWKGRIEDEDEVFVILKTNEDTYPALERRILELHPYEVPMITATSIRAGSKSYLAWLSKALQRRNKW